MINTARRHKLTRMAFALVIVSFLLSTTVSLISLHAMSKRNLRDMNKVLATQVYDYIRGELSAPITAARTMSSSSFLVDALQQEEQSSEKDFAAMMAEHLAGIESGLGYQAGFVISDASGKYYTRDGIIRTIDPSEDGDDAWYTSFAESGDQYGLDVDRDERNPNDLTVYVNARVTDNDGKFLGICGIGVRMTGIQELFRTFEESFDVRIDLVDSDGVVQIDTNNANIEALDLGDMIEKNQSEDYVYEELGNGGFAVTKYVEDLDWYLIVKSDGPHEAYRFASIIGLNAALCAFVLVVLVIALRINQRRTRELTAASFVDAATTLLNRRAFEQDKADLLSRETAHDLVCVTADVNGLKVVNDSLGHDAGDELIRGAADCLRVCFKPYGEVYRTGGDEFAALIHVSEEKLEELQAELGRVVDAWSGQKVDGVSISCGYASAWEFPGLSATELNKISDERMYADKERYYEETGRTRRE